ncbi:MAG: hypothetical protein B7X41_19235 [Microbacterium sp. 14-71-5]|uniref:hypothetical protein n=1 Tax=Microbacterium sp. 13-71-7 TaxID=1970399 RepID=UPI000BD79133|nr:hypothetical protein [Microbacterium sp. 13-71-7]OZB79656.1 MAG: hypothetical protein B7X41_19235 [Microbacterium sp. 14-71-5]OZB81018.1 MAG: hypothetical protein B7X32_17980 [Microbacterium sp. 13-71-7]
MKTTIGLAQARDLLRTREELLDSGRTVREIRELVAAGRVIRVRRDRYVDAVAHEGLWGEGRHLVAVVAAHLNADPPGPVFWGPSAAVLLGLPLYRLSPKKVHTVILGARHGRTRAGILQHGVGLDEADIVDVDGIRCTSPERTVLDLACTTSPETALSAADAALRRVAVEGHRQDPDRAADWHRRMSLRAAVRTRGIRRAREILDFADGRAQLPGESVSRLQLHRIGFTGLELQQQVIGSEGDEYWIDFGFPRNRVFGEFDGQGKYVDPAVRGTHSAEDAVLAEKRREDDIRGVTGWRFARWEDRHVRTPDALTARLQAFGVRPPA